MIPNKISVGQTERIVLEVAMRTLDVVTKNLAMTLGATLSEALETTSSS